MLIQKALEGDVVAASEVLDRVLGKAKVTIQLQEPHPTIDEMHVRLLAKQKEAPHMLHRELDLPLPLPLPPVIDSRESGVAG